MSHIFIISILVGSDFGSPCLSAFVPKAVILGVIIVDVSSSISPYI